MKSVFTHGLGMGLMRNDKHSLQMTTDDFIESQVDKLQRSAGTASALISATPKGCIQ